MNKRKIMLNTKNIYTIYFIKKYMQNIKKIFLKKQELIKKQKFIMWRENTPKFRTKQIYNPIIPLNIYQTWKTKELPPKMREIVDYNKSFNPAFKFVLFDDKDCRDFIDDNFREDVLNAYDTLVPGAYKTDLWRYCVLYIYGGIYLDIQFKCVNGFKFIGLTEKEHLTLDMTNTNENTYVSNSLIVTKYRNPRILQAIIQIVTNVNNRYYGDSPFDVTGNIMFGKLFNSEEKNKSIIKKCLDKERKRCILLNGINILEEYPEYRDEVSENYEAYSELWRNQLIYTDI